MNTGRSWTLNPGIAQLGVLGLGQNFTFECLKAEALPIYLVYSRTQKMPLHLLEQAACPMRDGDLHQMWDSGPGYCLRV